MKLTEARLLAASIAAGTASSNAKHAEESAALSSALFNAIARAAAAGRTELEESDLDAVAAGDDKARAELEQAIAAMTGQPVEIDDN